MKSSSPDAVLLEQISSLKQQIKDEELKNEQLRRSEEKYRSMFENAVEGMFQTAADGRFLTVNPAYARMFGYSSSEELTTGAINLATNIHTNHEERRRFKKLMDQNGIVQQFEFSALKKDGTRIWVSLNARAVKETTDRTLYYEGTIEDITELKQAQSELKGALEKLKQSGEMLCAAINATHESLILIDQRGTVVLSNRIAAERLGANPRHFTNTCQYDYFSPALADSRRRQFDKVFSTGTPVHFEDMRAERHFDVYCYPVKDEEGEISRAAVFASDITERKKAEEKLKQQADAMEASADGIAILNKHELYVYVNRAHARIYGYDTSEELLGKSWRVLYDDEELQRFDQNIMSQLRQNGQWTGEATGKRKDGSLFPQELSLTALDDGGLICIVQDLTNRKRMRDALEESEEKYRTIFENAMEGIFQTTPEGRLISANPALARISGYNSPAEIIDHLVNLDTQLYVQSEDRIIFKDLLQKHGFVERFETQLHRKDGSKVWVSMNAQSVTDATGRVVYEGNLEDITTRKQAEEELRAAHQRLFDIIEFLPDATFVVDNEKKVVAWNLACEQLTGVKKEAILGKGDYEYAIPFYGERRQLLIDYVTVDSDELRQKYQSIRSEEQHLYGEAFTPMLYNGKGATLSGKASPLFDRTGKMVGAIESLRDITEVKRLESHLRQAQKMESVGTLAGGIAHDFNNILTALIGYASLMQMKMDKTDLLQSYVDQILSGCGKAADLIRGLLAFSRQQPIVLVPLDINNTVRATRKLLERLLTEDIDLRTSLTKDDTIVKADKSQIDQILFNLVTNARDAMPNGGTLVIETDVMYMDYSFIAAHGFGVPARYVRISVSDTGMGMDRETREKIFEPFFTTKETGKGTGLGLATVYGIVKQHKGYITIYSELNEGTSFHIYLPAIKTATYQELGQPVSIATGKETVLIAEDDQAVRNTMAEVLSQYGYTVIEAMDGEDAIQKFKQIGGVDLIILDSVMPKKNGRQAFEEIRGIDQHIKVLFTSGYTKDIVLGKGIEDGQFNFISKPLSPKALVEKVREVLDSEG